MGTSIFTYLKKKRSQNKSKKDFVEYLNEINKKADSIFYLSEPQIFTMAKENNIAFKYGENFLVTKDGNLVLAYELKGASYSGITLEDELSYLQSRISFFNGLKTEIEANIVIQKKEVDTKSKNDYENKNIYADEIIKKWQNNQKIYEIKYFIIFSTLNKNITGALESFKSKATSEEQANNNENFSFNAKLKILNEISEEIRAKLSSFKPVILKADDILNFYATYSNAQETNLKYSHELLSDCYISSNVEFKKDYIIFYRNDGKVIYARFLSIKVYETENISSVISTNMVQNKNEFSAFLHIKPYSKEKAIKKVKDTMAFSQNIVRTELEGLLEQIKADRENLIEVSYSLYLQGENLDILEEKTNELKSILSNQGLNVVRETINQKALYFSFFPSRGNLNARKRTLKISNLATIANFENEVSGFNKNDWGNEAVTTFKHLNGTPFLFNFHWQENGDRPSGHTMIIGGTGAGKTTMIQFLMANLYKYNIDIFAMDKLRGMYNFTTFTDGEYHDSDGENFKLNPFSLPYTSDNIAFLKHWLCYMAQVKDDEHKAIEEIANTIERIYAFGKSNEEQVITLHNFIESLPVSEETNLKTRFKNYEKSIFNHKEDALNFTKQLSILNMDGILNDHKMASLTAMYIFHKLKNQAKNSTSKRGFFCFIDELKDYLNEPTMREKILEAILEVRKIGGVMCMGFQTISLFKEIEKGTSFLDNIANFIIFPTSNQQTIAELTEMIDLNPSEAKFLMNTNPNSRKVLLKMKLRNESAYLDVDLSRLNNYLKIFTSSSDNVMKMKNLQEKFPNEWRKQYLQN